MLAHRLRVWLTYNNTHPPKSPAQERNYWVQYEFFSEPLEKTLNLVLMGSFCVPKLVRPHETSVQQYHAHAHNFRPTTMIFRPELGPGPIILCARGLESVVHVTDRLPPALRAAESSPL
jgi:hypothetical protein